MESLLREMREVDVVRDIGAGLAVGEISSSESISEARRCSKLMLLEETSSCDSSKLRTISRCPDRWRPVKDEWMGRALECQV